MMNSKKGPLEIKYKWKFWKKRKCSDRHTIAEFGIIFAELEDFMTIFLDRGKQYALSQGKVVSDATMQPPRTNVQRQNIHKRW